ncbi:MAG: L-cysteine:1D-myo-inositol 2-amino-2-deoxy-alpha-D-glucopyranoside ligase [Frankiales bacterium]|jgi:L-cysteine:1D-myo-inositol 2-amino-2-deoxy-alpha-D-glucopyranoside ligase|nr:L-cysteine:1D-myo-inositol 2-amino-2-deoxy-alpha-D-glucopyranoside ligase [Frankiales bacterium]
MDAWAAPELPALPGHGVPLRIHDTGSDRLVSTSPGPTALLYVCGITPYDATHLGHAATYIAFDLLQRVWRDGGHDVHYVQNVTDIDDPLLERAAATGDDWADLAQRETQLFREDMTALGVIPPTEYVGAVEAIPRIVSLIERLRDRGAAYTLDGDEHLDLYFPVAADPRFGAVANLDTAEMIRLSAERGGDPDRPGKKDPLDCLLWQVQRPGEPAWESPFGSGRPGWHVECTAIALDLLGDTIDVMGGGRDLAFPHHELGASEAHAATGTQPFARAYVHAGLVGLNGEKMSKSKGNLVFVSTLLAGGADPMAVRLALLAHHYRDDWEWTDDQLITASERLAQWRAAVSADVGPPAEQLLADVRRQLADDLQAPLALAAVDRWAAEVRNGRGDDIAAPGLVRDLVLALLGVRL